MNHVNINARLKNKIFVGNGPLLVPDFFKEMEHLGVALGNKYVIDKGLKNGVFAVL